MTHNDSKNGAIENESSEKREAFVYIVECADGTLYTGWTYDPEARLRQHNAGKGAKYTRSRLPVSLVYTEKLPDQQVARRREYALKQLSRAAKQDLISEKN
jgi:putative endonuclease